MNSFSELPLINPLQQNIARAGYTVPTPIQQQAIPHLLQGRDLLGIAQTGTGKTAAFGLPILQSLIEKNVKTKPYHCQVLILTPTRELATQIQESLKTYGTDLKISSTVVFGGVKENAQIMAMSRAPHILIATPGRLLDLMNQRKIVLDSIHTFVLDEADRMLDMGFINDVRKIIAKLPQKRQTLLFSATMPQDIAQLASKILKDPVRVEVTPPSTTVERIDQTLMMVEKKNKAKLLKHILQTQDYTKVLVFTRTKRGANKVVEDLGKWHIRSSAIHGNKSQSAREKALSDFKSGRCKILVATDIAARGIDVPEISHVFNFDLPEEPQTYVHRIGRTARAGRGGVAIAFCDPAEKGLLRDIERNSRIKIEETKDHPFAIGSSREQAFRPSSRPAPSRNRSSYPSDRRPRLVTRAP